jgi:hypothetical protein
MAAASRVSSPLRWKSYKNIWKAGFEVINKTTGGKLGEALSTARSKLSDIKNAFSEKMDAAKEAVRGAIDKDQGLLQLLLVAAASQDAAFLYLRELFPRPAISTAHSVSTGTERLWTSHIS